MILSRGCLACAALVVACNTGGGWEGAWKGTVRDSAGITIVENPANGVWTDAARWRLEEDLRIGSVDGDTLYQFGNVAGIGVGPRGDILVLDDQADRPLRVFDPDGSFVRAEGGRGSGPGEFRVGAGPVLPAGDSLFLIPDGGGARAHVFDVDGHYVRTIQTTLSELTDRWGVLSQGIPVLQLGLSTMPGMAQDDDLVDVLLALGRDGAARDTILRFPSGRQIFFQGGMPELTFFAPEPWWVVGADDGIWLGVNDRYQVGWYESGALRRLVARAFDPVPVSERDREIVLEAWIAIFAERIPNAATTLRQLAQFNEVFPAYQQFLVSPDGHLWVQQIQIPSTLSEQEIAEVDPTTGWGSRAWDVFRSDGRYLGQVQHPQGFEALTIGNDHVHGVWRDDLGVQYVMRLRILRGD